MPTIPDPCPIIPPPCPPEKGTWAEEIFKDCPVPETPLVPLPPGSPGYEVPGVVTDLPPDANAWNWSPAFEFPLGGTLL
jgi:hypothetical protein